MANVLIIDDDESFCQALSQMVADLGQPVSYALTLTEGWREASTGGHEVIFLDVVLPDGNGLKLLPKLRELPANPEVIIITGLDIPDGAELAMKSGAWDYVDKQSSIKQMLLPLTRALKYLEEKKGRRDLQMTQAAKPGKIIGFTGAKGGVGTTTVALNVAAALAQLDKQVIAVELKPNRGTFSLILNQNPAINLKDLLACDPESLGGPDLERYLSKSDSGLKVLFGPQKAADFCDIEPTRAAALIKGLANLAEYLIIDLPPYPSPAFQAVLRACHYAVLVSEREQFSVRSGKTLLELCQLWGMGGSHIGAVLTNRIVLPISMKFETIKAQLGCDILGVVPYSLEACSVSQISGQPIVLFQPGNLAAVSLSQIAGRLA